MYKYALIFLFFGTVEAQPFSAAALISAPYSSSGPLDPDLFWAKLNNNANDSTTHGNNGTAIGSPPYVTGQDGIANHAISLNDISQYVSVGSNIGLLQPTGNFTISGWFQTSGSSQQEIFGSYSQISTVAGIIIGVNVDGASGAHFGVLLGRNTGATPDVDFKVVSSSVSVSDGAWHLGVATWDGTTLKVYVDGVISGSTLWSLAPGYTGSTFTYLGAIQVGSSQSGLFSGFLDDIRLYSRCLSAAEIGTGTGTLFGNNAQ